MDKFDEMMKMLNEKSEVGEFGQVIAVDRKFEIFERAWCVAELAQAHRSHILQSLKVFSLEKSNEVDSAIRTCPLSVGKSSHSLDKS